MGGAFGWANILVGLSRRALLAHYRQPGPTTRLGDRFDRPMDPKASSFASSSLPEHGGGQIASQLFPNLQLFRGFCQPYMISDKASTPLPPSLTMRLGGPAHSAPRTQPNQTNKNAKQGGKQ